MMKIVFCATLTIFLASYSVQSQPFPDDHQAIRWVDSVFNVLSLEEKIGQLFMVQVYPDGNEQHHQVIQQLVTRQHIGGLVFTQGQAANLVRLNNRFQEEAKVPLLAGMALGQHLNLPLYDQFMFPQPLTLGAIQNDTLIYQLASSTASKMKRLGLHFGFVSLDMEEGPFFSSNAENREKKITAYIRGLQDNGIMATGEYFPGTKESALLDTWQTSLSDSRHLNLFQTLIDEKLMGIKTSSSFKVSSPEERKFVPATLSSVVTGNVLRNKLHFKGLTFSDHLNQQKIPTKDVRKLEKTAFMAGNDILLFSTQIPYATKQIKKEVKKNKLAAEKLEKSVKRILLAKYALSTGRWHPQRMDNLSLDLHPSSDVALRYELYQHAVTALHNTEGLLPLSTRDHRYFASLTLGKGEEFQHTLNSYGFFSHYQKSDGDERRLIKELKNYDVVIAGIFEEPTEAEVTFLQELAKQTPLVINYCAPFSGLAAFQSFDHVIFVHENNSVTQVLLAEACFGASDVTGRLPAKLSEKLPVNTGVDVLKAGRIGYAPPEFVKLDRRTLSKIDDIVKEAINDQATPGAQVLIAKDGKIVFERHYGHYTYDSLKPVTRETIYDIASITKVAATLQVVMFLYDRKVIDLDKKISVYLPELKGTNKEHMIIRDILTHQAGLWPYIPFWTETMEDSTHLPHYYRNTPELDFHYQVSPGLYTSQAARDSVWNWVKAARLVSKKPREPYPYRYSDMGYYLMQRLIEKYVNQPMEEFLQQNLYDPMGLTSLSYLPLCKFPLSRIAPTENDEYFRNTLVYGLVHDQGAALFGGVAGHAGLFSNATDLAKLMQMHLQGGKYGGERFLLSGTLGTFTSQQYESNRRGIGWDKPAKAQWYGPTSYYASGKTFGHTGFTGTAVWADPEFNLIYVFLSNRIHPDAENRKLIKNNIRTRIQEVIYEAMWNYSQYGCMD